MPKLATMDTRTTGVTRVIEDKVDGIIVVKIEEVDSDQAVDVEAIEVVEVEVVAEEEEVAEAILDLDLALMAEVVVVITITVTIVIRAIDGRMFVVVGLNLPLDQH